LVWCPEPLRELEHAALNEVSNGIEINRSSVTAEAQGLERYRTAAREAIKHLRRCTRVSVAHKLAQRFDVLLRAGVFEQ
jgi:hypothetical protein